MPVASSSIASTLAATGSVGHALVLDLTPAARNLDRMGEQLVAFLPQGVMGLLVLLVAYAVAGRCRGWVRAGVNRAVGHGDPGTALGQLTFGLVIVFGVLAATAVMGVGVGSLLAGLGVTGFVIGFALKDVLENYVAGLLLLFSRPFGPGDQIRSGTFYGEVLNVSTRATTIATYDGLEVIIPNAQIFSNPLVNDTRLGRREGILTIKLPAGQDLAARLAALEAKVAAVPGVLPDPKPEARAVDPDGVKVEVRFWSPPRQEALAEVTHQVVLLLASGAAG